MLKKNIILMDYGRDNLEPILNSDFFDVHTLIVGTLEKANKIKKKYDYINVLVRNDINAFYLEQEVEIDYSILEVFKNTQLKVEGFLNRVTSDSSISQYLYYQALFYWIGRFKDNEIDGIICGEIEHGGTFDSVIFDVASYYNKKVYILEIAFGNELAISNQIFDYKNKKYLTIDFDAFPLKNFTQEKYIHALKIKPEINIQNIKGNGIKKFIINASKQSINKIFGYLLPRFFLSIVGMYNKYLFSMKLSWFSQFLGLLYIKNLKRYYNSKCKNYDKDVEHIYYALHMEPEATIQPRAIFHNQLAIIKTISNNLPKEWILYVKDHPHQFDNYNNSKKYYFLVTIWKYRTKKFYDEISKMGNVKLLKTNISSRLIIQNSKAIVTINGTVILEAIKEQKPVIIFSQNTTPLKFVKDVFDIKNSNDLKEAIRIIRKNFIPEYKNLNNILSSYYYTVDISNEGIVQFLESLFTDSNHNY